MSKLKKKLIKLSRKHPEFKDEFLSFAKKKASSIPKESVHQKIAINETTERFIRWAQMRDEATKVRDMVKFIERGWGIEVKEPKGKKPKGALRWEKGDKCLIETKSHNNETTLDIYEEFEGQEGIIIETEEQDPSLKQGKYGDVMARFNGKEVRLPEAQKGRYIGIKKPKFNFQDDGRDHIEAIYSSDPSSQPSPEQIAISESYVLRGERRGEDRSFKYYTGPPIGMVSRSSGVQLGFIAAQRGFKYRSFNPAKGKLLYLGKGNKRPSSWKNEYADMIREAQDKEDK